MNWLINLTMFESIEVDMFLCHDDTLIHQLTHFVFSIVHL